MPNVKMRGTKPVAKRISLAQGMRLSSTELVSGARFRTRPHERKPDNAVRRRPKLKVDIEAGRVTITTRRTVNRKPLPKYAWESSTAPNTRPWRPKAR